MIIEAFVGVEKFSKTVAILLDAAIIIYFFIFLLLLCFLTFTACKKKKMPERISRFEKKED